MREVGASGKGRCPVDHAAFSQQKTARVAEPVEPNAVERDSEGVWHVRSHAQTRAVLRSSDTKQAGFNAEMTERTMGRMRLPVLYQEGKEHNEQRKQTARFFSPRTVSENYRELMEELVKSLIQELLRKQRMELDVLSFRLAVKVAGKVVGLTDSRLPGMNRRLESFFANDATEFGWNPRTLVSFARSQTQVAAFFYLDVKPAIEARKKSPKEDVISHLISKGYGDAEILTECLTYAAAGMVTTREFISAAAWHMLEQPTVRERYLAGDEEERHELLQEILRLEPVVGHLYRCATADIPLENGGETVTIPAGSLIDLHIYATNADETVTGECPLMVVPGRELQKEKVGPAVISFGDGSHRCPGAFVAIQESDVFLQKLLALEDLRIERKPSVSWNDLVAGYELRGFTVAVG